MVQNGGPVRTRFAPGPTGFVQPQARSEVLADRLAPYLENAQLVSNPIGEA